MGAVKYRCKAINNRKLICNAPVDSEGDLCNQCYKGVKALNKLRFLGWFKEAIPLDEGLRERIKELTKGVSSDLNEEIVDLDDEII